MKKSPNDIGNKKSTSSNQKDLFNPELFLTIDEINKKFGKDTVCFGYQLGNLDYDKESAKKSK